MNKIAPEGQVFICGACGKRSKDRYGNQEIDRGWDESCMLHSVLCYEDSIVMDKCGARVVKATAVEKPEDN